MTRLSLWNLGQDSDSSSLVSAFTKPNVKLARLFQTGREAQLWLDWEELQLSRSYKAPGTVSVLGTFPSLSTFYQDYSSVSSDEMPEDEAAGETCCATTNIGGKGAS